VKNTHIVAFIKVGFFIVCCYQLIVMKSMFYYRLTGGVLAVYWM